MSVVFGASRLIRRRQDGLRAGLKPSTVRGRSGSFLLEGCACERTPTDCAAWKSWSRRPLALFKRAGLPDIAYASPAQCGRNVHIGLSLHVRRLPSPATVHPEKGVHQSSPCPSASRAARSSLPFIDSWPTIMQRANAAAVRGRSCTTLG